MQVFATADTQSAILNAGTFPLDNSPDQFGPLTAAAVSRAAAQAVRICAKSSLPNALYVVNSVHLSSQLHVKQGALDLLGSSHSSPKPLPFNAIDFGQSVSPGLSAHCFLHALVRGGQYYKAGRYAELMMQQGLRIRKATLEKIVGSLSQNKISSILARNPLRRLSKLAATGLKIHSEHFISSGNRAACRILMHARKFGQDRSERMYQALISGCLMQGEILVGSLLFVLLVKDWQAHAARKKLGENEAGGDEADSGNDYSAGGHILDGYQGEDHDLEELAYTPRMSRSQESWRATASTPYPTRHLLKDITNSIETAFSQNPETKGDQAYLQEPLQALANLVLLVEEGHIHFGNLSPLIRAIYVCPKTRERIWVRKKRERIQVDGYRYLHGFLLRVIKSFQGESRLRIPPLDTRSYNSLLHYSLRHRLSPSLASIVLDHMCTKRQLQPNIETYNILLRTGTILRRSDISDAVLQVLRQDQRSFGRLVTALSPSESEKSSAAADSLGQISGEHSPPGPSAVVAAYTADQVLVHGSARAKGVLARKMQNLRKEEFVLPEQIRFPHEIPKADHVTFCSYIAHLVSIGHPQLIANSVFYLFPELNHDNPALAELEGEARLVARKQSRDECVRRAVRLGPVFFATLLNAMAKAGRTGLAERVWLLAVEAQQASWMPDFCPGIAPWRLSIHAYTSMLQCYANEAIKGVPRKVSLSQARRDSRGHQNVCGWGRFMHRPSEAGELRRHETGRKLGIMLFRSVISGDYTTFQTLREVGGSAVDIASKRSEAAAQVAADIQEDEHVDEKPVAPLQKLQPPVPDARFFNAALRLFSLQPGMRARSVRGTRSHVNKLLRWTTQLYARAGVMPSSWTPELGEVAKAMVSAGYSVPDGLQHLFVGRWEPGTMSWEPPPALNRSPFAYPDSLQRTFRPYSIPTVKTRGLPVRCLIAMRRRKKQQAGRCRI